MADGPEKDTNGAKNDAPPLGEAELILLPVRQAVLFPGIILPLAIGRPASIAGAQEAARSQRMLGVILQTDPTVEDPSPASSTASARSPRSFATLPRLKASIM